MEQVLCILLLMVTSQTAAQLLFAGRCPYQNVVQNFDFSSFAGRWHEIEKYFSFFELGGRCISSKFFLSSPGDTTFGVINKQETVFDNRVTTIRGQAVSVSSTSEAKLSVTFNNVMIPGLTGARSDGNYWVLDTNYSNYAIVWSCEDMGFFHTQLLWILMRNRKPNASAVQRVKDIITSRGLRTSYLQVTDQTNCN
ncbi:apolipoprotein D-like [Homarus americanus]|uniref:Apolipoprotein D n=1 Tax=Homarus americanus TaxID=6706 RepID=A0A8J5JDK1_HOMAM|nr:apolipoprotein D-like [Homarus americanus]KAG7155910.1 Apolipoprotein D-like 5 [Homarus americanus]